MGQQMNLINKIFNNETIRVIWNKEKEKYYNTYVVDIEVMFIIIESILIKNAEPIK